MKKLVIDIGGTSIKSAIFDGNEYILYYQEKINREYPLKSLCAQIEYYDIKKLDKILIAATGVINKWGEVVNVNGILKRYLGMNIRKEVEQKYNIKTLVINDVNAFAYSKPCPKSAYYIMIGTGIGGAFINDKNLLVGENGAAGEIGFISIGNKRFEDLGSTRALVQMAFDEYGLLVKTGKEFFDKLKNEEYKNEYEKCFDKWCDILADGICIICYLFNPKYIVIGGAVAKQKDLIHPKLISKLEQKLENIFIKELEILFHEVNKYSVFDGLISYEKKANK